MTTSHYIERENERNFGRKLESVKYLYKIKTL